MPDAEVGAKLGLKFALDLTMVGKPSSLEDLVYQTIEYGAITEVGTTDTKHSRGRRLTVMSDGLSGSLTGRGRGLCRYVQRILRICSAN